MIELQTVELRMQACLHHTHAAAGWFHVSDNTTLLSSIFFFASTFVKVQFTAPNPREAQTLTVGQS